jgi:hypothetical protein
VAERFSLHERVRLVGDGLPVAPGSVGVVIGFYRRDPVSYLVTFEEGVHEVEGHHLDLADEGDD